MKLTVMTEGVMIGPLAQHWLVTRGALLELASMGKSIHLVVETEMNVSLTLRCLIQLTESG